MDLTITCTTLDGVPVIEVAGDIDVYTAPQLRIPVRDAAKDGSFIVDMSGCDFLDSTGLGVLIGALKTARNHDNRMVIAGVQDGVMKAFRVTGLSKVFAICDTVADAIRAVQADGR